MEADSAWFVTWAVRCGQESTAIEGISHIEPQILDDDKMKEYQLAFLDAVRLGQARVVKELLEIIHINPDLLQETPESRSALHLAAADDFPEVIDILLNYGANIYRTDQFGRTSLHLAAKHSSGRCLEVLLRKMESISQVDVDGATAIHVAAYSKNFAGLKLLRHRVKNQDSWLNSRTSSGKTVFLCAAEGGSLEIVRYLYEILGKQVLTARCYEGLKALHYSVMNGSLAVVNFLLEHNLDPNITSVNGSTALHILTDACVKSLEKLAITKALVGRMTHVNTQVKDGNTTLHLLCRGLNKDDESSLAFLIEKNADVNLSNNTRRTLMHVLAELHSKEKAYSFAKILIENGADLSIKDRQGRTCVMSALEMRLLPDNRDAEKVHFVEMLLNHIDDVSFFVDGQERLPFGRVIKTHQWGLAQELLRFSPNVDDQEADNDGNTPLLQACATQCSLSFFKELLKLSRKPLILQTHRERNMLHVAASAGQSQLIDILIDHGFDVDGRTRSESYAMTALMLAAQNGHTGATQKLLGRGARKDAEDHGWTALHFSCWNGGPKEAVSLLQSRILIEQTKAEFYKNGTERVSPFHLAAMAGRFEILEHLLTSNLDLKVDHASSSGRKAIYAAAYKGHTNSVKLLLSKGADINGDEESTGCTPLHIASTSGQEECVALLLGQGANPCIRDKSNMLPELVALRNGFDSIYCTIQDYRTWNNENSQSSANLNESNVNQRTSSSNNLNDCKIRHSNDKVSTPILTRALFDAIEDGGMKLCERLLAKGASINQSCPSHHGCTSCTPLLISLIHGRKEITDLLLKEGAEILGEACEKSSRRGYNPLHFVAEIGNAKLLRLFLEKGLKNPGIPPVTPLHVAVANKKIDCVTILLDHYGNSPRLINPQSQVHQSSAFNATRPSPDDTARTKNELVNVTDRSEGSMQNSLEPTGESTSFLEAKISPKDLKWVWVLNAITPTSYPGI